MNSIRPLATITLLAVVGVFLYFKINETEPTLPADVADWTLPAQIDYSGQTGVPSASDTSHQSASTSNSANSVQVAEPGQSTAPPFSPNQVTPSQTVGTSAPAWEQPAATDVGSVASTAPTTSETPSPQPVAPDLPPLPSVPPAAVQATADSANTTKTIPATAANVAPPISTSQTSLFAATRLAVHSALDRGELSQALLLLSDWYGDPSLTPQDSMEVQTLLNQLAGSVIYSTEHRLEPPYVVQTGDLLDGIAKKYQVPWQLLAKINGISREDELQTGQKLKVVRGPFNAMVDLSDRELTLMLDRRYAGKFSINIDPGATIEEGHWQVNQKLNTPANVSQIGSSPSVATEEQSLVLTNASSTSGQVVVVRGLELSATGSPASRDIRLNSGEVNDVYDIMSVGSRVIIRR